MEIEWKDVESTLKTTRADLTNPLNQ